MIPPKQGEVLAASWRKASYSVNNGQCVEVGSASAIMVRDSANPSGPMVGYPASAWQAFLSTAKSGAFDVAR